MSKLVVIRFFVIAFFISSVLASPYSAQAEDFDSEDVDEEANFDDYSDFSDQENAEVEDSLDSEELLPPVNPENTEVKKKAETPENKEPESEARTVEASGQVAADEPNYSLESDLHRIFINYHSAKTSTEKWNELIGKRRTEIYKIQKDDNLWSISKAFFGDGNYWPKIWSMNSEGITNPHLIAVNNNLRFVLGDESGPPIFTVTESNIDDETGTITVNKIEVEIPPPMKKPVAVIKDLPPSFPMWQGSYRREDYDSYGIDYGKRKISELADEFPLSFFVTDKEPDRLGVVQEMEDGSRLASTFQYIYVRMSKAGADIGDTFLVLLNRGPVVSNVSSSTTPLSIEVQGEIQLVERVDSEENKNVFRAIVTKLVSPITLGASIVKGQVEMARLNEAGPRSQIAAQIIGGQYFNRRVVYGTDAIIYLNRGSEDGLKDGDILPVRENRSIRNPRSTVKSNLRPIGWLQVVRATPKFSTAVVLRSWSDIRTGDVTGAGAQFAKSIIIDEAKEVDEEGAELAQKKEASVEELMNEEEVPAPQKAARSKTLTEEFEEDFSIGDPVEEPQNTDEYKEDVVNEDEDFG